MDLNLKKKKSPNKKNKIIDKKKIEIPSYNPINYHILNELHPLNRSEINNNYHVTSESESFARSQNDIPLRINEK